MSSFKSCLRYCVVVIPSFLVISFTNLASDHPFVHGQPTNFSFTSFNSTSVQDELILLDDAALYDSLGFIVLNSMNSATGTGSHCGKLMYKEKVQMFYPSTGAVASFQTSFTFSILPAPGQLTGDGFAFTFMPDNVTEGNPGGSMCVEVERNDGTQANSYFAVEFDTWQNTGYNDPSNNHIGIDVNSFTSVTTYNLCNLTSNHTHCSYLANPDTNFTAWIDYDATTEALDIWFANGSAATGGILKPNQPVIHFNLNQSNSLSKVFSSAYMYVGFSGSVGNAREINQIESWSFASSGLPVPPGPPSAPTPAPETSKLANSSQTVRVEIIVSAVVIIVLLLVVLACVIRCTRHRRNMTIKLPAVSDHHILNIGPRKFNFLELCIATMNFSEEQLLGSGGCGSVYKGVLQDTGSPVAVKRITKQSEQGETDFVAEISVISQVRHRNLVQLRGWCHEEGKLLLVYDFMSNTSLDKWLFIDPEKFRDSPPPRVLSWELRYNILTGVAAALYYLHEEWEQCILHRDIKASNVMLDTNFKAKLGDFGLARLIDHDKLPHTSLLAGTLGYLAPELPHTCKATKATDVYSFGILSLEVACGRRVFSPIAPQSPTLLLDYVWQEHKKKSIVNVVDPRLEMDFVEEEVLRVLHLGLLCSHPDPETRPNMRLVNRYLNGEVLMPCLPESRPVVFYPMNGQVEETESTKHTATFELEIQPCIAEEDPAKSFTNFLSKSDNSII
ncbi:hypothetical protein BDL97_02G200000 [Sphagnum fallax]|nr:hypothetical protein BDL97_02G200000 [Sphagnum fallax]